MSIKNYKKVILDKLIKKYNNRSAGNIVTNRRIILKPTELYKDYSKNNADISEKLNINEAASELKDLGLISISFLKFSDDIEKIYLLEESLDKIYEYLKDKYGVVPQNVLLNKVNEVIKRYSDGGELVKKYCDIVLKQSEDPRYTPVPERTEANLKMIDFLEKNTEYLYIREASMLVYGDSKWFENNNYEEICAFLGNVKGIAKEEQRDAVFESFYIMKSEQEIFIKGNWKIKWENYTLEISRLEGGIAITSADIKNIKQITVDAKSIMTVENKTSYQRVKADNAAIIYLGGYAGRYQTEFLKKVISDNQYLRYLHFGDIDVGGFLIHKHLCSETLKKFELYCMGIEELSDSHFGHCLKELTENDLIRLEGLIEDEEYSEVLKYMKENNVKLEQEIISYYLCKE